MAGFSFHAEGPEVPKGCLTVIFAAALGVVGGILTGRATRPPLGAVAAIAIFVAAVTALFWLPYRLGQRPVRRLLSGLGLGAGVAELGRRLDLSPAALRAFQCRYREVLIPKRRGGTRRLLVPDEQTKALQRRILHRLLVRLRAHPSAHAYERGRSIASNAAPHAGRAVLVKLDLVEFFPSTSSARIARYFRRIGWSRSAAALLTRLTTHEGGLPQGAPTSPRLSNLVNRQLDRLVERFVDRRRGSYTRYADDLTVSFPEDRPRQVRGTIQKIRQIAGSQGYRVHGKPKLGTYRRHQRQIVTGVVVNEKLDLPRSVRRRLRATEHRLRTTGKATLTAVQLAGWRSYLAMIRSSTDGPVRRPGSR